MKTLLLSVIFAATLCACHGRSVVTGQEPLGGFPEGTTGQGAGGGSISLPPPGEPVFVVKSIETTNEDGVLLSRRTFDYNEQGFLRENTNGGTGAESERKTYTYQENRIVEVSEEWGPAGVIAKEIWQLDAFGRSIERKYFEPPDAAAPHLRYTYEYPNDQSRHPSHVRLFRDGDSDGALDDEPSFTVSYSFDEAQRPSLLNFSGSLTESRTYTFAPNGCPEKIDISREGAGPPIAEEVLFECTFRSDGTLWYQDVTLRRAGAVIHSSRIRTTDYGPENRVGGYVHDFEGADGGADGTTDHVVQITYIEVPQQLWPFDIVPDIQEQLFWGEVASGGFPR